MDKKISWVVTLLTAAMLQACGGGGSSTSPAAPTVTDDAKNKVGAGTLAADVVAISSQQAGVVLATNTAADTGLVTFTLKGADAALTNAPVGTKIFLDPMPGFPFGLPATIVGNKSISKATQAGVAAPQQAEVEVIPPECIGATVSCQKLEAQPVNQNNWSEFFSNLNISFDYVPSNGLKVDGVSEILGSATPVNSSLQVGANCVAGNILAGGPIDSGLQTAVWVNFRIFWIN